MDHFQRHQIGLMVKNTLRSNSASEHARDLVLVSNIRILCVLGSLDLNKVRIHGLEEVVELFME